MSDTDIESGALGPEADDEAAAERFVLPMTALPERLDKVLARLMPQVSRGRLQGWIADGHVLVDGAAARVRSPVGPGTCIEVWPQPAPEDLAFAPEPVPFDVLADAPGWIVVMKPAGLVTHPGAGNWHGTLLNGLLHRYPELLRVARAGIVHRLDKDTSGLLVVARTEAARTDFVRQLQARSMRREYRALVHGWPSAGGTVDLPVGRDARVPVRMSSVHAVAAKPAITHYATLRRGRAAGQRLAEIACRLETGRTHQIRVHMAALRHPLLGDALYGGPALAGAQRQMLHARALGFRDPGTGDWKDFSCELPADFQAVQQAVDWETPVGNPPWP